MQRRLFVGLLLLTLLAATPLSASSQAPTQLGIHPATSDQSVANDLLFVGLTGPAGADRVLDASYSVDGELVFAERITFHQPDHSATEDAKPSQVPVELLAWHPEVRRYLLQKRAFGNLVTVTVSPQDDASFTIAVSTLLKRTHELQRLGLKPATNHSQVLVSAASTLGSDHPDTRASLSEKTACEDDCDYEYSQCENYCGIDAQCLNQCEVGLGWCLEDCDNTGCTGPTYEDSTATTVYSIQAAGGTGCDGFAGYPGIVVEYVRLVLKYTTTRTTTYCDGSQSSEVISVQYSSPMYCWYLSGYCNPAQGHFNPICPI